MPFDSKKQEKWAFANKKPWAKEWAAKTDQKNLPESINKTMNKKAIIKKAMKGKGGYGKGGPGSIFSKIGSVAKGAAKGALKGASDSLVSDKKNMGFRDPGSLVTAGIKGVLGGVAGAAKAAQAKPSPLSVPKLSTATPTKLPSISQGTFPKMPKPSVPAQVKAVPASSKASIVKKLKAK